jgi:putative ABC transport system substrate-binding protein
MAIEWRYAEGKIDLLPRLASELVRANVDVILTAGEPTILAARQATHNIPIVMAVSGDPIAAGFVASLSRPGGNITGLTGISPEVGGKRLKLLKEAVPKSSRVTVLWNSSHSGKRLEWNETQAASASLAIQLKSFELRNPEDLDAALPLITKDRPHAVIVFTDPLTLAYRKRISEFAVKNHLPMISEGSELAEAGVLLTYGLNLADLFRRAANYVDRILKGTKPSDLPVERPIKFELVINLKTAKQIGLTIPPNVVARADRVIR